MRIAFIGNSSEIPISMLLTTQIFYSITQMSCSATRKKKLHNPFHGSTLFFLIIIPSNNIRFVKPVIAPK
eukprot:snap_masked-scaffold_14-processed-gene-5.55-mRNA-1 protein AED:1.00 eAED:1.00 QI:0/0/0/0/1/1/2/0/69